MVSIGVFWLSALVCLGYQPWSVLAVSVGVSWLSALVCLGCQRWCVLAVSLGASQLHFADYHPSVLM